ncbi:family 2 glycosyl transferase [Methanococcus maripaludis X1]|uniref:Family 2 glycosyl transferase n=1 Tax=Methanococcus maripaludis X1 TaxID=1053692 RepID=G0H2R4_METMI|nr:glycosyltransferase family 2 protein [Methanococcus maripaludis]AEK19263.1 family 2 glycosyl transferase [Methanococcus maripaludis X1]
MNPQVSIIILNWNGWEDTIECLESLYRINYLNYNVVLIDNGSKDESIEKIQEYCSGKIEVNSKFFKYSKDNKPIEVFEISEKDARNNEFSKKEIFLKSKNDKKLLLIKNEDNYGFAGGNNVGMKFAIECLNSDYVLLLNNDTVVDENFLTEMVKVSETDEKIGIVGPKVYLYSEPNKIQTAGIKIRNEIAGIKNVMNYTMVGYFEVDVGKYDFIKKVDSLVGCCILVKTKPIKEIGQMDEEFFLYHEESDWLYRLSRKYSRYYTPFSKIWHKYSASSGGEYSPLVIYYTTRNSILYAKKHNNFINYLLFLSWLLTYNHGRRFVNYVFLQRKYYLLMHFYNGIWDGIVGKYGIRN